MGRRFDEPDLGATAGAGAEGGCLDMEVVTDKPSPARMYDYFLGGKDNFKVDRQAAERVLAVAPDVVGAARANRNFMHRVVAWCAEEGLGQFIDVGMGFPTSPTPLEVAWQVRPGPLVVGVDNDPVVVAHGRAGAWRIPMVGADMRQTGPLIDELDQWVDWHRPVAVLLIAVLHFVRDHGEAAGIVAAFTQRLAPGSLVVISHVCSDGADPEAVAKVEQVYAGSTAPGLFRTREQIRNLFGRLELVEPGLVPVQHWPQEDSLHRPLTALPVLGGVGRVPGGER
jgi:hypothetical protein